MYNAVGVRITDMPITSEKIFRALEEKALEGKNGYIEEMASA
jgi:hypothetical protein